MTPFHGMKIFIVILNWNGKRDTLDCLSSWRRVKAPHHTLVVDNGSTDDSVSAIKHMFPEVDIVETGHNLGYAEGNNVGVRAALQAGAESVLVLNNDTEVTPGFLEAFMNRSAPLQGGKPHRSDDRNLLDHLGGNWNPETANFDMIGRGEPAADWNESIELDYVCGVSIFALREVWEKVGLFDPRYFLFWEEADGAVEPFGTATDQRFVRKPFLYHRGSASFIGGRPHTTYYWARNRPSLDRAA